MKRAFKNLFIVMILWLNPAFTQNIVNGSFESATVNPGSGFITLGSGNKAINGWTVSSDNIDYVGTYWQASEGVRSIDLNGLTSGSISQTIRTSVGTVYEVRFDMAGNPEGQPTVKLMRVSVVGVSRDFTFDVTGRSKNNMGWKENFFTFTATDSATAIAFSTLITGAFGPVFDNVRVTTVNTPRSVRIIDATASVGGTVNIPIELVAQSNENALGFSLTFDTTILSNPQAAKGSDGTAATLNFNSNQSNLGRFGINLALPTGQTFTAGTRQIVVVTFTVNASTTATMTTIDFGDQPIAREVVDANASVLSTTWTAGKVTITRGYEADVAPRPNGTNNGTVTTADWVQVGRFAAALDVARTDINEFQRADCAPKPCGDGRITTADWVQAGRYAAGLDPVVPACGPLSSTSALFAAESRDKNTVGTVFKNTGSRTFRAVNANFKPGRIDSLIMELEAQGDENAVGFSLNFDPRVLVFQNVVLGKGAMSATLNKNDSKKDSGRVGITLALPTGQMFAMAKHAIVIATFMVITNPPAASTIIGFSDQPVAREVVDVNANILSATWTPATVAIMTTAVERRAEEIPASFELDQNYPNPFNPSTTIKFSLPKNGHVTLKIFDLVGREIAMLVDRELTTGRYEARWEANGVESGVYFYQIRAGEFTETKRLLLMK